MHKATRRSIKQYTPLLVVILILVILLALVAVTFALRAMQSESVFGAPAPTEEPTYMPTPEPTATPEPEPVFHSGYFVAEDGLFYPERALTRGECAAIVDRASNGVFSLPELSENEADIMLTEIALRTMLSGTFTEEELDRAMDTVAHRGTATVTHAEAAVFFNALFSLEKGAHSSYFPDVAPEYWAYDDIMTAGFCYHPLGTPEKPLESGQYLHDCVLYFVGEGGYFLKNHYEGSFFFDNTGAYTCGRAELDGYVREMLRSVTDESMSREEMLSAAYDHVRETFTYLRRHYYTNGDVGWALDEATTMYSTLRGNCYCYSSAFWAAARALGYDAKIVSGTYGTTEAPHGWVEIYDENGDRYTYDVEIEMVRHRSGYVNESLYAMNDHDRRNHVYMEFQLSDELQPRWAQSEILPK